jgi:hypothetical protein
MTTKKAENDGKKQVYLRVGVSSELGTAILPLSIMPWRQLTLVSIYGRLHD